MVCDLSDDKDLDRSVAALQLDPVAAVVLRDVESGAVLQSGKQAPAGHRGQPG